MKYGVQLYSVRDSVKSAGMKETLCRVARIGYQSVEFAGFGDASAEEVRAWLDELGLSVDGAHISIKELEPDTIEQTVQNMKTIGSPRIIIPSARLKTAEEIEIFLQGVAFASPILAREGMSLGFHNHDTEYLPNEDGIVPMDVLKEKANLFFELDTYWAYHAGVDPVAEMERMGDRLHLIHIKDGDPTLGKDGGKPLGMGTAPVAAVYRKALERALPMVVESETLNPDGMTEITKCFEYLKAQEH